MARADIGARLKGLRKLQPADPAQDQFYNGLSSIASGAVLQSSGAGRPPETGAGIACDPSEALNVKPAAVPDMTAVTAATAQWGPKRRVQKERPISPDRRLGTKVPVRVGIIVRPDYAARITKYSEMANSTPDEVVRRIWCETKRSILADLPQTMKEMIVVSRQRAGERSLYLGTTITLEKALLDAIAAEHDPLAVHGHAKLVKSAITPEFERVMDAELTRAGV